MELDRVGLAGQGRMEPDGMGMGGMEPDGVGGAG